MIQLDYEKFVRFINCQLNRRLTNLDYNLNFGEM